MGRNREGAPHDRTHPHRARPRRHRRRPATRGPAHRRPRRRRRRSRPAARVGLGRSVPRRRVRRSDDRRHPARLRRRRGRSRRGPVPPARAPRDGRARAGRQHRAVVAARGTGRARPGARRGRRGGRRADDRGRHPRRGRAREHRRVPQRERRRPPRAPPAPPRARRPARRPRPVAPGALGPRGVTRPLHLRPSAILLVAAGGAVGTAARAAIGAALPPLGVVPVATLAVNLPGAFLLGLLLEALARRGPDEGGRRTLRLLLGTGVLGGFTTYSTFSLDTVALLEGGHVVEYLLYTGGTLVLGVLAAALGIAVAGRRRAAA
ncbi:hypothetical protein C5C69_08625 [Rathayibacter sp. AY1C7]|nr:hypothetical protein C5C69_08625 [Rathayibacter sp. AY1C7]